MKYRLRHSPSPSAVVPAHSEEVRTRNVPRVRSAAPRLRFTKPSDSALGLALRVVAGIVFITLGQMKLFDSILLGTDAVTLPDGPAGFAQYLAVIGVPFPLLSAYSLCLVEMICGAGLVLSAFLPAPALLTRLAALPLFFDMLGATITVGLRNAMGHPVMLEGIAVTHQVWRLPLELSMLIITLLLLLKPLARREPTASSLPCAA